jgi:trk system potassium uptake protein TrkH
LSRPRLGVDLAATFNLVGGLVKYLSLAPLAPAVVAAGYGESPLPFLLATVIGFSCALFVERISHPKRQVGMREGFLVVCLTWLVAAAVGALPYWLTADPQFRNPINCYFEAMSGFTTTGATIVTDIEGLPHGLQIWRQLTQWLGGMGIIVLALAVLPRLRVGGRQLLESELPGPEIEEMTLRIRQTAQRLWLLYIAITVVMIAALSVIAWTGLDSAMSFYEAVAHSFTTLPTGGFSTRARSLEGFGAVSQWTIAFFMVVGGVNFALMYRAFFRRQPRVFVRDEEFRLYLALLAAGSLLLAVELWTEGVLRDEAAIRHSVVNAVSVMTTTGYASVDFNEWPLLAAIVIVALMFVGGSAGSTGGSVKVVRHLLMARILRRELDQTVHPEAISRIHLNRRPVDERILRAVSSFVLLYVGVFAAGTLLLVIDAARVDSELRLLDAIAAAATTLGNVGPAFGFAGPMGSFEPFSGFSKVVMIVLMWVGRLEIIPVAVLLTRSYWRV